MLLYPTFIPNRTNYNMLGIKLGIKKLAIPWGWRYNPPTLMGKAEKGEKSIE